MIRSTFNFPASASISHSFHTSALNASTSTSRGVKKLNNLRKEERWRNAQAKKPSVVLGTRPGDTAKWENCDLRKVLVDVGDLASSTKLIPSKEPVGTVHVPGQMNFGVGQAEYKMLFKDLPMLSTKTSPLRGTNLPLENKDDIEADARRRANMQTRELNKANAFAKLLDLRNANAGGIAYENRRRIITAFSTPENPYNPGRSEVQAALLTYQIRNLWAHLTTFRRDVNNRRGLRKLVHQRAKVLRYLRGVDQDRYENVLERLALEPESVEGELVV